MNVDAIKLETSTGGLSAAIPIRAGLNVVAVPAEVAREAFTERSNCWARISSKHGSRWVHWSELKDTRIVSVRSEQPARECGCRNMHQLLDDLQREIELLSQPDAKNCDACPAAAERLLPHIARIREHLGGESRNLADAPASTSDIDSILRSLQNDGGDAPVLISDQQIDSDPRHARDAVKGMTTAGHRQVIVFTSRPEVWSDAISHQVRTVKTGTDRNETTSTQQSPSPTAKRSDARQVTAQQQSTIEHDRHHVLRNACDGMTDAEARILWNCGIRTVSDFKSANIDELYRRVRRYSAGVRYRGASFAHCRFSFQRLSNWHNHLTGGRATSRKQTRRMSATTSAETQHNRVADQAGRSTHSGIERSNEAERNREQQVKRERAEQERIGRQRAEQEQQVERDQERRAERKRAKQLRREDQARADREQMERRRAEQQEKEERERAEREQRKQVERERAEKAERERARIERERAERERAEQERIHREQAEEERQRTERKREEEQRRVERERAERERAERERAERERAERERAERERAERERAERERAERERAERESAERESAERESAEREREESERQAAERAQAEHDRAERQRRRDREREHREREDRERAECQRADREHREQDRRERRRGKRRSQREERHRSEWDRDERVHARADSSHDDVAESDQERPLRFFLNRSDQVAKAPSIGNKTAKKLRRADIRRVGELIDADAEAAASKIPDHRITADVIKQWQQQASLQCRVPEIRGHDAQILVACEVTEPEDLKSYEPRDLLQLVDPFAQSKAGERIIRGGKNPDLDEVKDWITWANSSRHMDAA